MWRLRDNHFKLLNSGKKQDLDEVVGKHCGINLIYSSFYKGFKDARPSEGNVTATPQFIKKDNTVARVSVVLDR